jgi:hypothetical protein
LVTQPGEPTTAFVGELREGLISVLPDNRAQYEKAGAGDHQGQPWPAAHTRVTRWPPPLSTTSLTLSELAVTCLPSWLSALAVSSCLPSWSLAVSGRLPSWSSPLVTLSSRLPSWSSALAASNCLPSWSSCKGAHPRGSGGVRARGRPSWCALDGHLARGRVGRLEALETRSAGVERQARVRLRRRAGRRGGRKERAARTTVAGDIEMTSEGLRLLALSEAQNNNSNN